MDFLIDFLTYDGKVAVALLVFYLFYRFLLKKETFHRFNRAVLVGTAVLSFLMPLCVITIRRPAEPGVLVMEMTPVEQELAPVVGNTFPSWPVLLAIVLFWAGAAFALVRVMVSIISILKIIRHGRLVQEEKDCKIVVTDRDIDPFSWMRYIVLSRKDWEGNRVPILTHEKAHVSHGHSMELLLVDLFSVLQWFNPAIWMLRSDLRELHEYEADDAVLRAGADVKEYQYLIIRKAVGKSGYSVANSFNHSILKNRITMMSKSKSPRSRVLRVLWALPLICLAICLQARTVYVPSDNYSNEIFADEGNSDNPEKIVTIKIDSDGRVVVDGKKILLKDTAGYLRSLDVPVQELQFKVDMDEDAPEEMIKQFQDQLDQAYAPKRPQELEEIVVISPMEKEDGPVPFMLANPDTMPMFQGEKMVAFSHWVGTRIKRPEGCDHVGTMKVSFVVDTDGAVRDIKVVHSVCEALDEMVVSIIKQSPKWEPAKCDGQPVDQCLTLPISFQIR